MENFLSDFGGFTSASSPFPEKSPYAGSFLLKNGLISRIPIKHQTIAIMIDENLCIPLFSIKGLQTAQQAEKLCQKFHYAAPTVYQSVRLYQVLFEVNNALIKLNISKLFALFGTDYIWNCENIKEFSLIEERYFVLIIPIRMKKEPLCRRISSNIILFNNTDILQCLCGNITPAKLIKTKHLAEIDLIIVKFRQDLYTFYRDCKNKIHYIDCDKNIKILGNDLLVIGQTVFQIYKGYLLKIATVESETIFLCRGNRFLTGEIFRHPSKRYRPIVHSSFYKKNEKGIYTLDYGKLSFL